MMYRETPHLFPRGYHLNYKYITAPEELMKPARALVPCRSTLPRTAAAATPALPRHRDSSEGHLHTSATPGGLHRRWDFTQAPLQCSSLSHPLRVRRAPTPGRHQRFKRWHPLYSTTFPVPCGSLICVRNRGPLKLFDNVTDVKKHQL